MIKGKRYWKVTQIGGVLLMNDDEALEIVRHYLKDDYFQGVEETEETLAEFESLDILDLIFETNAYREIKALDSDDGYVQTTVYNPKTGEVYSDFVDSGYLLVVDVPVELAHINAHITKQQHYEIMIEKAKEQLGHILPEGFDIEEHFRVLTYPEFCEE